MHRILALKFAAWLNPDFEFWVYKTIDFILFDHYRQMEESINESAKRKNEIEQIENKLKNDPEFMRLEELKLAERQATYFRSKQIKNQLDLFRGKES